MEGEGEKDTLGSEDLKTTSGDMVANYGDSSDSDAWGGDWPGAQAVSKIWADGREKRDFEVSTVSRQVMVTDEEIEHEISRTRNSILFPPVSLSVRGESWGDALATDSVSRDGAGELCVAKYTLEWTETYSALERVGVEEREHLARIDRFSRKAWQATLKSMRDVAKERTSTQIRIFVHDWVEDAASRIWQSFWSSDIPPSSFSPTMAVDFFIDILDTVGVSRDHGHRSEYKTWIGEALRSAWGRCLPMSEFDLGRNHATNGRPSSPAQVPEKESVRAPDKAEGKIAAFVKKFGLDGQNRKSPPRLQKRIERSKSKEHGENEVWPQARSRTSLSERSDTPLRRQGSDAGTSPVPERAKGSCTESKHEGARERKGRRDRDGPRPPGRPPRRSQRARGRSMRSQSEKPIMKALLLTARAAASRLLISARSAAKDCQNKKVTGIPRRMRAESESDAGTWQRVPDSGRGKDKELPTQSSSKKRTRHRSGTPDQIQAARHCKSRSRHRNADDSKPEGRSSRHSQDIDKTAQGRSKPQNRSRSRSPQKVEALRVQSKPQNRSRSRSPKKDKAGRSRSKKRSRTPFRCSEKDLQSVQMRNNPRRRSQSHSPHKKEALHQSDSKRRNCSRSKGQEKSKASRNRSKRRNRSRLRTSTCFTQPGSQDGMEKKLRPERSRSKKKAKQEARQEKGIEVKRDADRQRKGSEKEATNIERRVKDESKEERRRDDKQDVKKDHKDCKDDRRDEIKNGHTDSKEKRGEEINRDDRDIDGRKKEERENDDRQKQRSARSRKRREDKKDKNGNADRHDYKARGAKDKRDTARADRRLGLAGRSGSGGRRQEASRSRPRGPCHKKAPQANSSPAKKTDSVVRKRLNRSSTSRSRCRSRNRSRGSSSSSSSSSSSGGSSSSRPGFQNFEKEFNRREAARISAQACKQPSAKAVSKKHHVEMKPKEEARGKEKPLEYPSRLPEVKDPERARRIQDLAVEIARMKALLAKEKMEAVQQQESAQAMPHRRAPLEDDGGSSEDSIEDVELQHRMAKVLTGSRQSF